ncbi:MAG TPA: EAL domain-containing protein, partial [bacterium]|nr:EAL domain-containing protein [bacterium]
ESGRNRVRVYQPDQDSQAPAVARMDWQRRIQEALEEDLFVLTAQPILDLRNNRTSHYEVLLRMMGAQGKIIPPGVFLDTAERLGLIHGIDQWVVRHAIRLIAAHKKQGRAISLVTNVSARTLADAEIVPLIQRELELSGVDPRFLALEMAESAAITNIDKAGKFAAALKQVGCRVGLDDFGVGFASFHHLKHLPVDYLKIDASFIRDLPRDTTNQQLVRTMVAVARAFGKETIAKFVSDAGTLRLLKEYGVDYAQGFHIGAEAKEITSITVDSASGPRRV